MNWKTFRAIILMALLVGFSVALGVAILKHIDGLGIFSIALGIVFFAFILFWECGLPESGRGLDSNIGKNLSHVANTIQDPKFIKLLSTLIGAINKLESKLDRLEEKHDILHDAVLKLSQKLKPSPEDQSTGRNTFTGKHEG